MFEAFAALGSGIESWVTAVGLVVGGVWVYRRFRREEEDHPFIQASCDLVLIGKQDDQFLIEIVATLVNKGKVTHKFSEFDFNLDGLKANAPLRHDQRWQGQVDFPDSLVQGTFVPRSIGHFFLPPQIEGKYSYVTSVPDSVTFLILHCRFRYGYDQSLGHTMERTIALPPIPASG